MTQLTAVSVTIGAVNPGIFTLASGSGQAIAVNQDGSLVAPAGSVPGIATHPAKPGDMITIYATGLGAVSPSIEAGAVAGTTLRNTVVQPTILIGGVSQKPAFSGLAPEFVGVNQINVAVPQLSAGIVPLQIQAGGVTTSDQVTIAVGN